MRAKYSRRDEKIIIFFNIINIWKECQDGRNDSATCTFRLKWPTEFSIRGLASRQDHPSGYRR